MDANDDRIALATIRAVLIGTSDDLDASALEFVYDSRPAAQDHPLPWFETLGGRLGSRQHPFRRRHTDRFQRRLLLGDGRIGVVRHEPHVVTRSAKRRDRLGRTVDRLAQQPDNSVDVAQNGGGRCHTDSVPRFEPFPGLRYREETSARSAPPYDVLSEEQRAWYAERDPRNVVHVDMPRGERPYERAATTLEAWRAEGTLVADDTASFTIHRMTFRDETGRTRETVGVIGALEVVDEGAGGVLPHERTTPKDKTDRLDLTRATSCNLSCVWGLSLATGLTAALGPAGSSVSDFVDESGVGHRIERIDEPERLSAIASIVGSADVLIADGHHRYAVARTFRNETRGTDLESAATTTMAYVGELVADQLSIAAIHRLYRGVAAADLTSMLEQSFEFGEHRAIPDDVLSRMRDEGSLFLLDSPDAGRFITPRPEAFVGLRDLDSLRLEEAIRPDAVEVAYQHGVDDVRRRLASGEFTTAVLIRPTGIDEIRRTAAEGLLMPPKSTFFTPKLRTGLVIRDLRLG